MMKLAKAHREINLNGGMRMSNIKVCNGRSSDQWWPEWVAYKWRKVLLSLDSTHSTGGRPLSAGNQRGALWLASEFRRAIISRLNILLRGDIKARCQPRRHQVHLAAVSKRTSWWGVCSRRDTVVASWACRYPWWWRDDEKMALRAYQKCSAMKCWKIVGPLKNLGLHVFYGEMLNRR
jgi:hypothetical protein